MTGPLRRAAALVFLLAGCAAEPPRPDRLGLEAARFADLPGWQADDPALALPALRRSCAAGMADPAPALGITAADWREPCARLAGIDGSAAARSYFETNFVPFKASGKDGAEGLFTGYYEAELKGSRTRDARYSIPLYRRPPDLVSVDLGRFRSDLHGDRIAGRVADGRLVPYPSRAEIEDGALAGQDLELLWVDSAVDAFFLAIQGSGRVVMADGGVVRVGYDGDNGQRYVAIGRLLVEQGVPKESISMQFLRDWIAGHGKAGTDLMRRNPSFVFFRELAGEGPLGSEGVALTPGRSAAIDRHFLSFGLPLWVDASDAMAPGGRLRRLLVAQDTGGAIAGPVRADIFFGYGPDAAAEAGQLKGTGGYWLLLPKSAALRRAGARS